MKIPCITAEQMREADRITIEEFVPVEKLMENAGRISADAAYEFFHPRSVAILVGKGNNGGDGLVAARYLHKKGVNVFVVLADSALNDLPLKQLERIKKLGIGIGSEISGKPELVIDALLGYSAKGAPRGRVAELIKEAKKLDVPVLCIDIPSGFDATAGEWFSPAFENAVVLTLGLPKTKMDGNSKIKKLLVADIGIPNEVYGRIGVYVEDFFDGKEWVGG